MMRLLHFFVLPIILIPALLTAIAPVRAMDLYSYDLDSLVYLSSDVIDADPISLQTGNGPNITNVRATRVYMGHFHVRETVKVKAMDFFQVPDRHIGAGYYINRGRNIGKGDHLTLFLAKAHSVFLYDIPKNADIYWPAPSGVKMLDQDRIKSFYQYENPGPYELEWTEPDRLKALPTPEQFRQQMAASISRVESLRPLLTKKAIPADKSDLLNILRQRKPTGPRNGRWERDAISEAACDQIVSLHDLDAVADALAITEYRNLTRALETPQGRDFLIKVVGDPAQPLARRLGCANAMYAAFNWWEAKTNEDYVSRLVDLCWDVRAAPGLTTAILDQLDTLAQLNVSGANTPPHPAEAQMVAGLPTLLKLYGAADSPMVRFSVEKIVLKAAGYDTYQTLKSPCGPVLSLVQPPDLPLSDLPPGAGKLTYQMSIRWGDSTWRDAADLTQALLLINVKSGARYSLPLGREIYGSDSMEDRSMTRQTDIPASLPHGRYRILLEFARPKQPVSTGYGYETEL